MYIMSRSDVYPRLLNNSQRFVIPALSWNLYRFRVKHGMTSEKMLFNTLDVYPIVVEDFDDINL